MGGLRPRLGPFSLAVSDESVARLRPSGLPDASGLVEAAAGVIDPLLGVADADAGAGAVAAALLAIGPGGLLAGGGDADRLLRLEQAIAGRLPVGLGLARASAARPASACAPSASAASACVTAACAFSFDRRATTLSFTGSGRALRSAAPAGAARRSAGAGTAMPGERREAGRRHVLGQPAGLRGQGDPVP